MILAVDPGEKMGLAIVNPLLRRIASHRSALPACEVVRVATSWEGLGPLPEIDEGVVEYQYGGRIHRGPRRVSAASVIKLAFRAGHAAALIPAPIRYALAPQVWKGSLCSGGGTIAKAAFCNRISRNLTDSERAQVWQFPENRRLDVLDAIGLAWAVAHMSPGDLARHVIHEDGLFLTHSNALSGAVTGGFRAAKGKT